MSEEEEIIVQPPAPPKKTLLGMPRTPDAHQWARKWSTWLALASASATAGLGAYALLPGRAQGMVPDLVLGVLGGVAILSALLVPLATSLQQQQKKAE